MKNLYEYNNFKLATNLFNDLESWYDQFKIDVEPIKSIFLKTNIIIDYPETEDEETNMFEDSDIIKFVRYKNEILYCVTVEYMGGTNHDELASLFNKSVEHKDIVHGFISELGNKMVLSMNGIFDKSDVDFVVDNYNKNLKKDSIFKSFPAIDKGELYIANFIDRRGNLDDIFGDVILYNDFKKIDITFYSYKLLLLFQKDLNFLKTLDIKDIKRIYPNISTNDSNKVISELDKIIGDKKIMKTLKLPKNTSAAEYKNLKTKYRFTESKEE